VTAITSAPLADQRALSAGTTQRFVLLLSLFLVSSVQLASMLVGNPNAPDRAGGCFLAAGVNPSASGTALLLPQVNESSALNECLAQYGTGLPPWWPPYAITAGLVAAAGLVYLLLAAGRRRTVPVVAVGQGGELAEELTALTARAGLARLPRFVMDPAAMDADAVTFGLPGRYTVCLHAGLVKLFRSNPEEFRTVVLHELAHIKNRDVGLTYVTIAAWRVYLILLLLPTAVSSAWGLLSGGKAVPVFWAVTRTADLKSLAVAAFVVLLVYLARTDVMRARETYADIDAAIWNERIAAPGGEGKGTGLLAAFWQLWRTHPVSRQRADASASAAAMFRVSSLQMFLTGAAVEMILYQFQDDLSPVSSAVGGPQYWPGVVAAALIASVACVGLWRAAASAALTGSPAPTGLPAGLWLGAGLMAGEVIAGSAANIEWLPDAPVFLLVLLLFATVAMVWTAQFAGLCVAARHGRGSRLVMAAGLAVIWAVIAIWLIWWYEEGSLAPAGISLISGRDAQLLMSGLDGPVIRGHHDMQLVVDALISPSEGYWLFAVAGALLWVAPLLMWAHRIRAGSPRLRSILLAGLGGGAVCCSGAVAVMAYMHSWQVPADQRSASYLLVFFGCLAACVVVGMTAAAVVATLVRGLRLLAALMASGAASLAGLAGVYVLVSWDGCVAPLNTMVNSCAWRPVSGWEFFRTFGGLALGFGSTAAAVAATALLTLTTLAAAVHRRTGSVSATPDRAMPVLPAPNVPRFRPGRLLAERSAIVALTGMIVMMLAVTFSMTGADLGSPGGEGSGTATDSLTVNQATQLYPAASASPKETGEMIAAWLKYGGAHLAIALFNANVKLGDAMSQSAAKVFRDANGQYSLVTGAQFRTAEAPTASACIAITQEVRRAEAYFPVPSTSLQRQWQSMLTGLMIGAQRCVRAVSTASLPQLLASFDDLNHASEAWGRVTNQLTSAAGRFCKAC
jgi:Zn-dependent protease with chaperone function